MSLRDEREEGRYRVLTRRAALLGGGQVLLMAALAGRMYYLQVVEAQRYQVLSDENHINVRLLAPARGRILDRFGQKLAINQQNYRAVLVAEQAGDIESTLNAVGTLISLTPAERRKVLHDLHNVHPFVPVMVHDNLSWDEMSRLEVNLPDLPGINIEVGSARAYPFAERVGHAVGYVAAVTEKELDGDPLLELPDFRTGKSGVEKSEDLTLRGAAGTSQVEVNAFGRVVREIGKVEGTPGADVVIGIDMALQDFAVKRIATQEAASCVVLDAVTGEVLVMASSPGYDPNAFTQGLSEALWQQLNTDPHGPLNNKAIQGVYPPGSTFKPCVAMAGLESGVITPDFSVTCTGATQLGDHVFHCWWHGGHGTLDLHGGLKNSCDIYFYTLADKVGVDRIADMAHKLGFGKPVGIDIPNERAGLIPTKAWKLATYNIPWQAGENYSIGIGQGYIAATPLQMVTMLARLVTNRTVVPHLVRSGGVLETDKSFDADAGAAVFAAAGFDPRNINAVLGGMNAVVNEEGGTAYGARITEPGFAMGGKSGTAQVRQISAAERAAGLIKPDQLPWNERDHALFIAFAPVDNPRYVCAVVVEHGIGGSKIAAPIAHDVLLECQKRDPGRRVPEEMSVVAAVTSPLPPPSDEPEP